MDPRGEQCAALLLEQGESVGRWSVELGCEPDNAAAQASEGLRIVPVGCHTTCPDTPSQIAPAHAPAHVHRDRFARVGNPDGNR
jgi:hypothetical protein